MLEADVDTDSVIRGRQLDSILAQVARYVCMQDSLSDGSVGSTGLQHWSDLIGRHTALVPDVPRDTGWPADTGGVRGSARHQQRVIDCLEIQEAGVGVEEGRVVVAGVGVVVPGIRE